MPFFFFLRKTCFTNISIVTWNFNNLSPIYRLDSLLYVFSLQFVMLPITIHLFY